MRKLFCVILMLSIISGCMIYNVSGGTLITENLSESKLSDLQSEFTDYCTQRHGSAVETAIYDYAQIGDTVYFYGTSDFPWASKPIYEKLGDYYVYSSSITGPDGIGLFVCKDGEIYHAKTAYESGIITDLATFMQVTEPDFVNVWRIGDANGDGELNVKDATTVQKHLAGIDTEKVILEPVMDMNCDEQINIKDATAIQKKLADIK